MPLRLAEEPGAQEASLAKAIAQLLWETIIPSAL
jgi:hypothetical protein